MNTGPPLEVKVWGEFACFTRPEMKVERVSYPLMTPSAARGVLEAIFWKPEFHWHVREIAVLKPIQHFSILRNEVNSKIFISSVKAWSVKGEGHFAADGDRAQRHTLALRDVAYVIWADVVLQPRAQNENVAKYRDQFRRRVKRGQCYHTPYLGCREFPASFGTPAEQDTPIEITDDLGLMLFDMHYTGDDMPQPVFFHARLEKGILNIPSELYQTEVGTNAT
ncbi:MAG: type I-C CRISPR-associated protein Cas5 [Dehalococcoidia bacterium]|nr:type I-C CRISPR-associated protein Cas5 [Dehalococcoidia bacterium]